MEWDSKRQCPKRTSTKQTKVLEDIESRLFKTQNEIEQLKITKRDLSSKIKDTKSEISKLKHNICSVPNQVSGGTYEAKQNKERFKRLIATAKKKIRVSTQWRDTATGIVRKTKQEINDLRMNKTVHLKSFQTSEEEMKVRELRVQEMEEELKTLEETRKKFSSETRQVEESYQVNSTRIQEECDDLDEKIDSLAVAISFAEEEGGEEIEKGKPIEDDAKSLSVGDFLQQVGANSAEDFVDDMNRSKYRDEASIKMKDILQNEIGIMKDATEESLTSRTREIESLLQKRRGTLSRMKSDIHNLHDILFEYMREEIKSCGGSDSGRDDEIDMKLM